MENDLKGLSRKEFLERYILETAGRLVDLPPAVIVRRASNLWEELIKEVTK